MGCGTDQMHLDPNNAGCSFMEWDQQQCLATSPAACTWDGKAWDGSGYDMGAFTPTGLWIPPAQQVQPQYPVEQAPYGLPLPPQAQPLNITPQVLSWTEIQQQQQQQMQQMQQQQALQTLLEDSDDAVMALPPRLACGAGSVRQEEELLRGCPVTAATDLDGELCPEADVGLIPAQSLSDQGKLVVVLDLDETLVRFREGPVHWRPFFAEFLDSIKSCCEVVLWTASTEECAQRVMSTLDPDGDRLHHKVYRTDRWFKGVPYTKDLTLLNRDMRRVVIIENTFECCASNPANSILVTDYINPDPTDIALRIVRDTLVAIAEDPAISVPDYLQHQDAAGALTSGRFKVLGMIGTYYCVTQENQRRRRLELATKESVKQFALSATIAVVAAALSPQPQSCAHGDGSGAPKSPCIIREVSTHLEENSSESTQVLAPAALSSPQ